jgi:hypothetical protein
MQRRRASRIRRENSYRPIRNELSLRAWPDIIYSDFYVNEYNPPKASLSERFFKLSPKQEILGAILILLFFLCISSLVATRTPTVYIDEPVFADPAANLYLGSGFTSTMWGEDRHELWSSQPPLYSSLLYVFFKCFGFGLFQARMANAVMAAAGGLLIWAGLRRARFIESPGYRLMALVLVLSGSATTLAFRTIRYDVGAFLVSALVFFTWCLPSHWRTRYLWLLLSSMLCLVSGVPMLPYVSLVLFLQLLVYHGQNVRRMISVIIGFGLGAGCLLLFYNHFGVLDHFLHFVSSVTSATRREKPSFGQLLYGKPFGSSSLLVSFFGNPVSYQDMKTMFDYSTFILFLVLIYLSRKMWRSTDVKTHKLIAFVALTTLVIPPVIQLSAHYWSDYRWMTYMPLAVVIPRLVEIACENKTLTFTRRGVFTAISLSAFMGVPFRSLLPLADWSARSVTPLNRVCEQVVKPSDVVVCQCKTYFAIRPRAELVFCTGLSAMGELRFVKDLPTNQVSLICLYPTNVADITAVVGGHWKKLNLDNVPEAGALKHTRYAVDFYRRQDAGNQ